MRRDGPLEGKGNSNFGYVRYWYIEFGCERQLVVPVYHVNSKTRSFNTGRNLWKAETNARLLDYSK
jgi:hypothetical protein